LSTRTSTPTSRTGCARTPPAPRHGQNYHQWLSGQYGLKKLVEHIWMLIGIAKTCETITELKDKMNALTGKVPVQMRLYLPLPVPPEH